MIGNSDIDSVHVLTPNQFHYPMSKEAVEAGKHVITEKPLAMSSRETADLVKAGRDIVSGTGFDNNIICIDEKEILAVASIAQPLATDSTVSSGL